MSETVFTSLELSEHRNPIRTRQTLDICCLVKNVHVFADSNFVKHLSR
jgi:hypothetical protein